MTIKYVNITIIAFLLYHSPIVIVVNVNDNKNTSNNIIFKGDFLLIILDKAKAKLNTIVIKAINGNINSKSLKISVKSKYLTKIK